MTKLFIAYSSKIVPKFKQLVTTAVECGYQILALDIESALSIQDLGYTVTFVEDWLSAPERVNFWKRAIELELQFHPSVYEENDEHLAYRIQSDHVAMAGFWYEYELQKSLERSFLSRGVTEIKFPIFRNYGAAIAQSEASTFGIYWEKQTSKRINVKLVEIANKNRSLKKTIRVTKGIIKYLYSVVENIAKSRNVTSKTIMLACSAGELYYELPVVQELKNRKSLYRLLIVITNVNNIEAQKIGRAIGFNVISGLATFPIAFSGKSVVQANATIKNCEFQDIYTNHKEHFKEFETVRWPSLDIKKRKYREIVRQNNVVICLVTAGEDRDHQMFGEVCAERGIPSLSLPHGILAFTQRGLTTTRFFGVGLKISEELSITSGVPAKNIVRLRNLDPLHEYPTDSIYMTEGKSTILVLLEPIKASGDTRVYGHPMIGYKEQIEALRCLSCLIDKNSSYNFIIKTHPGWPEYEVIKFADKKLMNFVVPRDTSLADLVEKVDLVIALNYAATALVAVARAEIPTLLFWTAQNLVNVPIGYANISLFSKMGNLVTSFDELEIDLNAFNEDPAFRDRLTMKCHSFKHEYVMIEPYESVVDFSLRLIEE